MNILSSSLDDTQDKLNQRAQQISTDTAERVQGAQEKQRQLLRKLCEVRTKAETILEAKQMLTIDRSAEMQACARIADLKQRAEDITQQHMERNFETKQVTETKLPQEELMSLLEMFKQQKNGLKRAKQILVSDLNAVRKFEDKN